MNSQPDDAVVVFPDLDDDPTPVVGIVVDEGRGALPFRLIHGESLVAAAAWAAGEAGVDLLDQTVGWDSIGATGDPLLLHDPLCPMTPPTFLRACVEQAAAEDRIVVGVRPVTDTVKELVAVAEGSAQIGATVDRDSLVSVCSPNVLPASVVEDVVRDDRLPSTDFVALVTALRERYDDRVVFVEAPPEARRIATDADIAVLAALTAPVART